MRSNAIESSVWRSLRRVRRKAHHRLRRAHIHSTIGQRRRGVTDLIELVHREDIPHGAGLDHTSLAVLGKARTPYRPRQQGMPSSSRMPDRLARLLRPSAPGYPAPTPTPEPFGPRNRDHGLLSIAVFCRTALRTFASTEVRGWSARSPRAVNRKRRRSRQ